MSQSQKGKIFCIKNTTIQNNKYFVYKGKKYIINFDVLVMNSNYFYKNKNKYENIELIQLLNDDESVLDIQEETIETFILSCSNKPFQVNNSSVIHLNYLSIKYDYPSLTNITNEYIEEHSEELVFQTLLFKIRMKKITENKVNGMNEIDTNNEEKIISKNICKYIEEEEGGKEEEMLSLPIPVLYRIIHNYYENNLNNQTNQSQKIINFLFKAIDKYGKDASILFNNIDFHKENISVMNRLLKDYSDQFDFNMINSTLLKTTTEITSEMNKKKEEIKYLFEDMKKEFEKQKKELIEIKEEEKKRIEEIERRYEERMNRMNNEFEQIKEENKKQLEILQKENERMKEENNKIINHHNIINIERILCFLMNNCEIKELDETTRKEFFKSIISKGKEKEKDKCKDISIQYKNNKMIQRILCIHDIYSCLFNQKQTNSTENGDFDSEIKFVLDNIDHPSLSVDHVEYLCNHNDLHTMFVNLVKNYEYFSIELDYQSKSLKSIAQTIFDIKKSSPNLTNKVNIMFKIFYQNDTQENNYFSINIQYHELDENVFNNILNTLISKLNSNITSINKYRFYNCSRLSQISIPSSVTSIEDHAFDHCCFLTQINIPSSVTSIGESAFYECSSLVQITIPSSVTSIGKYAFYRCSSLKQIIIPKSVTSIGGSAFYCCSSLSQVTIPSSVTSIGCSTFSECTSLIQIMIPSSVTSIESGTFYRCTSLTQIIIPSSVTSIESGTFYGCSSLAEVTIPPSVTSIGSNAFRLCTSLAQINIPSSVTSIWSSAFEDCYSLLQITIPSSVTTVYDSTFKNCTSLMQVTIPSSVTLIRENAFSHCASLTQIEIPSSVKSIKGCAFQNCTMLAKITIPYSVKPEGYGIFEGCPLIQDILPYSFK